MLNFFLTDINAKDLYLTPMQTEEEPIEILIAHFCLFQALKE